MDNLLFYTLAVYGLCFILMHGTIFDTIRNYLIYQISWFGTLITCPVCTGFWCGLGLSPFFFKFTMFLPAAFYSSAACYILHLATGVLLVKSGLTDE